VKKDNVEITMEKDVDLSRRNFLRIGTGALMGGAILGGIGGSIIKPGTAHAALPGYLPVPTSSLDIDFVKKTAFSYYFTAGG
jgi:hypothetical protein